MKKTLWVVGGIVLLIILYLVLRDGSLSQGPGGPELVSMTDGNNTIAVADQEANGDLVNIDLVILANGGFVVVHEDSDGAPGADIGNSNVLIGSHENLSIALDRDVEAGETLHAMLHRDADDDGVYEFPGTDVPIRDAQDNILVVAFEIIGSQETEDTQEEGQDQGAGVEADVELDAGLSVGEGAVITYTDSGFSPGEITVSRGTAVVFRNESSRGFWPASAQHPTHTVYPGSDIDKCGTGQAAQIFDACQSIAPGGTYSFTFEETGTWGYHDHLRASNFGRITVE